MKIKAGLIGILLLFSCNPVTVMQHADLDNHYPEVDIGIGVNYPCFMLENYGSHARFGLFFSGDLNPDLSRPDWTSTGIFISREIQPNITIGATVGRRMGENKGTQYGFFIGIDVWPFRGVKP